MESFGGKLYCNQEKIIALKLWISAVLVYKENVLSQAAGVLHILEQLQMVSFDSSTYMKKIVAGSNKVGFLEDYSLKLTEYASLVEVMDDNLRNNMQECLPEGYEMTADGVDERQLYLDVEYDINELIRLQKISKDEITKDEQAKLDVLLMKQRSIWLPEKMNLNGNTYQEQYMTDRLNKLKIPWSQEKIDALWKACNEIYNKYGIIIDPRFLLAVIIHEGTGSFNTSSSNLAADGQNGIEVIFSLDLMKANSLIFGKVLGYAYYGEKFSNVANENRTILAMGTGDIFDYINWNTPIIDLNKECVREGVYAGHSAWGNGVEAIYEHLTEDGNGMVYSQYVANINSTIIENIIINSDMQLPDYNFCIEQNGQDSKGKEDGTWTIICIK